jgi:hypothetical protein
MVGSWGGEKRHFVSGIFPNVSNTGNWAIVVHILTNYIVEIGHLEQLFL